MRYIAGMNKFTDLLDDYLEVKGEVDAAKAGWNGYGADFVDANYYLLERRDKARDALNEYVAKLHER